jgi:hypothetical protein
MQVEDADLLGFKPEASGLEGLKAYIKANEI